MGTPPRRPTLDEYSAQGFWQAAREDRHGAVSFAFAIGTDGKVKNIQVLESSGSADLDEAGRVALANCIFRPGIQDGKLVEVTAKLMYVF